MKKRNLLLSALVLCAVAFGAKYIREDLRLTDSGGVKYLGFHIPSLSASKTFTLPSGDGTALQVLQTDGAGTLAWTSAAHTDGSNELTNLGLAASISSNELTVSLKQVDGSSDPTVLNPVYMGYRSATLSSGSYSRASITSAASITLGADDSLGVTSWVGVGSRSTLYVYWIISSPSELCLSSALHDEGYVTDATSLTGSGDTSDSALYCTSPHSNKPIRLIGRVSAVWNSPNWSDLDSVSLVPFRKRRFTKVFTSNGTWVSQFDVYSALVCGHGGGGGGGGGLSSGDYGGMGGGGAATSCFSTPVIPGTSYSITIGAGGPGGAASTVGTDGTSSTFGSLLTFYGGIAGQRGNASLATDPRDITVSGSGVSGGGRGGLGGNGAIAAGASGLPGAFGAGGAAGAGGLGGAGGGGGGGGDGAGGHGGVGASGGSCGTAATVGTNGGGGGGGGSNSGATGCVGAQGGNGKVTVTWEQ